MLPTPSTTHVDTSRIYEPAEDSFLLLDTLSSDHETAFLSARFAAPGPAPLVLEIGTGSGVVLAFLTAHAETVFGRRGGVLSFGVDINGHACDAARETVRRACAGAGARKDVGRAGFFLGTLNADLTTPVRRGVVDVLVFNPPYLPSSPLASAAPAPASAPSTASASDALFAEGSHLLALSYAGGKDGMEVTQRVLDELDNVLHRERGVAYILFCAQNPSHVVWRDMYDAGWDVRKAGCSGKKAGRERLLVLRFARRMRCEG